MEKVWHNPALDAQNNPPGAEDFKYHYVTNSYSLIDKLTAPGHTAQNTWETTRNALDTKENHNPAGTVTYSQYDYTVNAIGQRTDVAQSGTAFAAAHTLDWGYNARGELTEEDHSDNTRDNAYQFDAIGNRERSAHGTLTLPGTDNYTADAHNQYAATPYATNPTHDADGNTTALDVPGAGIDTTTLTAATNLIWDGENRLRQITYNGTTEHFDYDYLGRRIRRTTPQDTHFHYDGWNLIAKSYATSTPVCTYTWGTDLSGTMGGAGGVGGLLATRAAGTDYYPPLRRQRQRLPVHRRQRQLRRPLRVRRLREDDVQVRRHLEQRDAPPLQHQDLRHRRDRALRLRIPVLQHSRGALAEARSDRGARRREPVWVRLEQRVG